MSNIQIITDSDGKEFVLIYHTYDEGFTTMAKEIYDAQVEHLTEIPTPNQLEEQANDQSL